MADRLGATAIGAMNQYRSRDSLAYLGLWYYLYNRAARSNVWVDEVSTDLLLSRSEGYYQQVQHFKSRGPSGELTHRTIHLPGPNEALAEAALLRQCAKHSDVFANHSSVFSYQLAGADFRAGLYDHYMRGLRLRHKAIAAAALRSVDDQYVLFTDVQRFYPSLSREHATDAWHTAADESHLPHKWAAVGDKLIEQQTAQGSGSLLTGPLFSHLLANLVLRPIDVDLESAPARYFRYVDDIALVGSRRDINASLDRFVGSAGGLGLHVYESGSDKWLEVPAKEWLKGQDDFEPDWLGKSWAHLVGSIKIYLLLNSETGSELRAAFTSEGFRLPIQDYSAAARERSRIVRFRDLARHQWFRRKANRVSESSLLGDARLLRDAFASEFWKTISGVDELHGYERRRVIPKLRFAAMRLVFIGSPDHLQEYASALGGIPELEGHRALLESIATRNVAQVLAMGTDVAQIAAAVFDAGDLVAEVPAGTASDSLNSLAYFLMQGTKVSWDRPLQRGTFSPLMRFASEGTDRELMRSPDRFIQEVACLHGLQEGPRHPTALRTPLDPDEMSAVEAAADLWQSYY